MIGPLKCGFPSPLFDPMMTKSLTKILQQKHGSSHGHTNTRQPHFSINIRIHFIHREHTGNQPVRSLLFACIQWPVTLGTKSVTYQTFILRFLSSSPRIYQLNVSTYLHHRKSLAIYLLVTHNMRSVEIILLLDNLFLDNLIIIALSCI